MSVWSSDKAVVPCLKYANQLFSHRFTGTRHFGIQLDTMSFTNPEKKRKVCRTQNTRRGPKHSTSISKVLAQNTPYSSPCECTPGTKKGDTPSTLRKKRCRVGHSENPCSHAKKSNGRGTNTATLLPWGSPRRRLAKHPCNLSPSHPCCTGCTCSSSTAPRFGSAR